MLFFILIDSANIFVSVKPLKQKPIALNKNAIITSARFVDIIINIKHIHIHILPTTNDFLLPCFSTNNVSGMSNNKQNSGIIASNNKICDPENPFTCAKNIYSIA